VTVVDRLVTPLRNVDVSALVHAAVNLDPIAAGADVPLLLLPVRLETRFTPDGATLRVRVYPDDIHVDALSAGLTADERSAGIAYWTGLWADGSAEDSAWKTLLQAVGRRRAGYVAYALTPTNLASRPAAGSAGAAAPTFPATAPSQPGPAVARLLPDRFVALAIQGEGAAASVSTGVGEQIAGDPAVWVMPVDGALTEALPGLDVNVDPAMHWMVDPDAAEQNGMALRIELAKPGQSVDTLLVFGLRTSQSAADTATAVEQLFQAHRFAGGASFLQQGTPTNNTETDRSGWQSSPELTPPQVKVPAAAPDLDANAVVLAGALGIDPSAFAAYADGDVREQALAKAVNTALWWPSWGSFLELIAGSDGSGISDGAREDVRDFFQDHVRGRGPLPALRIGDQPYGVLPVSSVDRRWKPAGEPLEPGLSALLGKIRAFWRGSLSKVPSVMQGDLDTALLDILGSDAVQLGLRVRSIVSLAYCMAVPKLTAGGDGGYCDVQTPLNIVTWRSLGFDPASVPELGALDKDTRPVGLPTVDGPADQAADLTGVPTSVFQALLTLAQDRESTAPGLASPDNQLPGLLNHAKQFQHVPPDLENVVHLAAANQATPDQISSMAGRIHTLVGMGGPSLLAAHQPIASVRGSLAEAALDPALSPADSSNLSLKAVGAWLHLQSRKMAFDAALKEIRDPDWQDELALAVAETLDLASHRFDAWTTGLVSRRLSDLRSTTPAGVTVGAYGWVENLSPGSTDLADGGYVHAPSLNHAATAGILRSGYLTHNADGSGTGALSMDLSSERVRAGLRVAEGVREGQPLGALIGYAIERGFKEATTTPGLVSIQRFVLSLRSLAPLSARLLTDRGDAPSPATEAIAAANVVDGLALLELRNGGLDVCNWLATNKPDNPFLDGAQDAPTWAPTPAECQAINRILDDGQAVHDAYADLMLAESVHQLVMGNTSRSAAVLDGIGGGDAPPVDPEVIRTPQRGVAFTQRLLVLVPEGGASAGWNETAARAAAEPRLEAWAGSLLGPATAVAVTAPGAAGNLTLADTGLCALDVVYDAATPGQLERRIRAARPELGEGVELGGVPIAVAPIAILAASAASLLAGSRPLLSRDLSRPSDSPKEDPGWTVSAAELAAAQTRIQAAADGLAKAASDLSTALASDPVDPAKLTKALAELAAFGIAVPAEPSAALGQAALAEAQRRGQVAKAPLATNPVDADSLSAAAKAIFGDAFQVLPLLEPAAGNRLSSAAGKLAPGGSAIRRFLRDVGSVRDAVGRYNEVLLFAEALGTGRSLEVVQLAADGTEGVSGWIGLPFDPAAPSPTSPVTSIVVDTSPAPSGNAPLAGLLVDEWLDQAPRRIERKDGTGPGKIREALVTTGVAVNANAPNARAPRAVLLAISPDGQPWTSGSLADTLAETLELAKLRAVTLERTIWAGRVLPALMEQSWSLQGEKVLDPSVFLAKAPADIQMHFVREES
jgi:hypothetical protein